MDIFAARLSFVPAEFKPIPQEHGASGKTLNLPGDDHVPKPQAFPHVRRDARARGHHRLHHDGSFRGRRRRRRRDGDPRFERQPAHADGARLAGGRRLSAMRGARERPLFQNFGIRSVLLIMRVPESGKSSTSGCSTHGPIVHAPPHKASPTRSDIAAAASTAVSTTLVGIGVPSKYRTLPESPESFSAVTL